LDWAGLGIDTIKVMPVPTITVGYIHQDNYFSYFPLVMGEYIWAWSGAVGAKPIDFSSQANGWNFVSVSLENHPK
jgi:hypothetical protein